MYTYIYKFFCIVDVLYALKVINRCDNFYLLLKFYNDYRYKWCSLSAFFGFVQKNCDQQNYNDNLLGWVRFKSGSFGTNRGWFSTLKTNKSRKLLTLYCLICFFFENWQIVGFCLISCINLFMSSRNQLRL